MNGMEADIERVLLNRERIAQRVDAMAGEIAAVYGPSRDGIVIVPVLTGALMFAADLIRRLPMRTQIHMMAASSYEGTTGTEPRLLYGPGDLVGGRHVLIVDDILDSGRTLQRVIADLRQHGAASVRSCVLLRKPGKAVTGVSADFVGFDIEDVFVVGYGLDFNNWYRNWPDIAVLRPELYA